MGFIRRLALLAATNILALGLIAAVNEHLFPIRQFAAEAAGLPMTTPWVLWILVGVLGLALTVLWEAFSIHRRLVGLINGWRGIPSPRDHLARLYGEAFDLWERGRDMLNPTPEEIRAFAVDVNVWTAVTQDWMRENIGAAEAKKLTDYGQYLSEPSFVYSGALLVTGPNADHNWQITSCDRMKRNIEVLMTSAAWTR